MKQIMYRVMAAILIISGTMATACKRSDVQENDAPQTVQSTELIRTSQSWGSIELPEYFEGSVGSRRR